MIPVKCGPNWTNHFDIIAIFVIFNRRPAAILDFAKFHFWPHSSLRGRETKFGLKFGDNRSNIFGVISVNFSWASAAILHFAKFHF